MAGSTGEKRLGVWELRVFVGLYGAGKPKQQSRTFEGNKRAAERELARLVSKADARKDESVEVPTEWSRDINQAIEGWKRNGWEDLSPNTTNRYEGIWRKHIRDTIGARKIASLTPYEVETYFRGLRRDSSGRRNTMIVEVWCGDDAGASAAGPVVSGSDPVAWGAHGGVAGGPGAVLGGDRSRSGDR